MHLGVSALLRRSFRPAHPPCASAQGSQPAVGLRVGVSLPGPLAPDSSSGFKLRLSEHRPARGPSQSPPLLPPLQAPQAGGGGQASRHAAELPRGPPRPAPGQGRPGCPSSGGHPAPPSGPGRAAGTLGQRLMFSGLHENQLVLSKPGPGPGFRKDRASQSLKLGSGTARPLQHSRVTVMPACPACVCGGWGPLSAS